MKIKTTLTTAALALLASAPLYAGHDYGDRYDPRYDRFERHDNGVRRHGQRGNHSFIDRARVIHVEPIHHTVRIPDRHRECWDEEVYDTRYDNHNYRHNSDDVSGGEGLIAGGIIGGVIGNQVGKGDGNKAATVLGTIVGATVGHEMAKGGSNYSEPQRYPTTRQRCSSRSDYYEEQRAAGYRVTYRYQGQEFTRHMDYHPGRWVEVRVNVTPRH